MASPVLSVEEIAQRQSFAEAQDTTVFTVFEGVCPVCYHDLMLTRIGGTKQFFDWNYPCNEHDEVEINHWEPSPDGFGAIGQKDFQCSNGHEISVFQDPHYDWTCSH